MKKETVGQWVLVVSVATALLSTSTVPAYSEPSLWRLKDKSDVEKFYNLRGVLSTNPKTKVRHRIEFAIAEYYYKVNDLIDASQAFKNYLKEDLSSINALLCKVYLYKISQIKDDKEALSILSKEILNERFAGLFTKNANVKFNSTFGNQYLISRTSDKVVVNLNGEPFADISTLIP